MNSPKNDGALLGRRSLLAGAAALLAASRFAHVSAQATPSPEASPTALQPFAAFPALPDASAPANGPMQVTASTNIIGDLVTQIGGARLNVHTILPANGDPHEYEPAPDDVQKVIGSKVVFVHGLNLDHWIQDIIDNAGGSFTTVTVTDGISTVVREIDGANEPDPHVWFDPTKTAQMVQNIAAALTAADPDGTNDYAARLAAYLDNLNTLDAGIASRVNLVPANARKFVTDHDAFGYYADRYGLEVIGTVIPSTSTDAEPSAKDVADLIAKIQSEGVKVIFAENTVSPKLAEALADEAHISVVDTLYSDSLGDPDSDAATYLDLMTSDTMKIVAALLGE